MGKNHLQTAETLYFVQFCCMLLQQIAALVAYFLSNLEKARISQAFYGFVTELSTVRGENSQNAP